MINDYPLSIWIIHYKKFLSVITVFMADGKKGRTSKHQKVPVFSCHLLIDPCRLLRQGVSRDAEHNVEVQNSFTSCSARQMGCASIFLPVIGWFVLFSHFKLVSVIPRNNRKVSCHLKNVFWWLWLQKISASIGTTRICDKRFHILVFVFINSTISVPIP